MSLMSNSTTLSKKTSRLLNMAADAAKKSTLNFTHGCIITKNGKKVIESIEQGLTNRGRPKKKVPQLNSQPKLLNRPYRLDFSW